MLTHEHIEQVRRRTRVSTVDAIHALTVAGGDVERAIEELNDHAHPGNRKIVAESRAEAQRLASALIAAGLWFECEATAGGKWLFAVALGAYARVCALHAALRGEQPIAA